MFVAGETFRARTSRLSLWLAVPLGAALLWATWLGEDAPPPRAQQTQTPLEIENLTSFVVRKDGQKQWEIAARKVEVSPRGDQTTAVEVSKATLFREGKPFVSLRAPKVRLANSSNNLEATGGVTGSGPDGFSFHTPIARWINRQKLVHCPQPVRARLREFEVVAPALEFRPAQQRLDVKKPLELRTHGAVLRAPSLRADLDKRQLHLGGGVELVFDPQTARLADAPTRRNSR